MFKKVKSLDNCSYKQSVSYKKDMPYHARLRNAKADCKDIEIIDLKNGFSKAIPRASDKKHK